MPFWLLVLYVMHTRPVDLVSKTARAADGAVAESPAITTVVAAIAVDSRATADMRRMRVMIRSLKTQGRGLGLSQRRSTVRPARHSSGDSPTCEPASHRAAQADLFRATP